MADHLPVEDRLLERHRDLVLGLKADRGRELVGALDRRQEQRPHRDPLIGDPEPHVARQLALGEQRLERVRERVRVGHLALVKDAGGQRGDAVAGDLGAAVYADLGGRDAPGLEVEADEALLLGRGQHVIVSPHALDGA